MCIGFKIMQNSLSEEVGISRLLSDSNANNMIFKIRH